ncbi:MAG: ABC transporter ATP-binding protein [Betaproteobacteria bacterium]|nr:ABC transporter ATP-binding protein [Betaproteobacteria bacterium]
MLAVDKLCIGYPQRSLVADLSFHLPAGNILAVLGPNGCGKTTLLRTLLGLLPAQQGEIRLQGTPIAALGPHQRARRIAYVPQTTAGFFDFSVIEVVEMARAAHLPWYAQPGPDDRDIARQALTDMHMADFAPCRFAQLSGGEQQLVLMARARAAGASLLLLDEPTANLDYRNQAHILNAMLQLKAQGTAILFTMHDPNHALRVADQALTLSRDGRANIGSVQQVINTATLSALYGIDFELQTTLGAVYPEKP